MAPLPRRVCCMSLFLSCWVATCYAANIVRPPTKRECKLLAETGSCVISSRIMKEYCRKACNDEHRRQHFEKLSPPIVDSFFDLVADDIDGNEVHFSDFKGKVTVIVNVASECGYTEEHYGEMVQLYHSLSSTTNDFDLLAFPCNQFDGQEPGDTEEIKAFAEENGVEFTVMDKINVNGPRTHDVYRFLKNAAGPQEIEWNFATYYVIDRNGKVRAFSDVTPLELRKTLDHLLNDI